MIKILHFGIKFLSDLAQVREVRYISSCNILAVNNNPLEDFFFEILVLSLK